MFWNRNQLNMLHFNWLGTGIKIRIEEPESTTLSETWQCWSPLSHPHWNQANNSILHVQNAWTKKHYRSQLKPRRRKKNLPMVKIPHNYIIWFKWTHRLKHCSSWWFVHWMAQSSSSLPMQYAWSGPPTDFRRPSIASLQWEENQNLPSQE